MTLEVRKLEFIQEFLKIQNEEVISSLENILHNGNKYADNQDFTIMSVEEYNESNDKSMSDSENGRLIKVDELKAKINKWG
ncbi:MAG: hypothetical protein ABIO60_10475 [Aquaticitalea sp.]